MVLFAPFLTVCIVLGSPRAVKIVRRAGGSPVPPVALNRGFHFDQRRRVVLKLAHRQPEPLLERFDSR